MPLPLPVPLPLPLPPRHGPKAPARPPCRLRLCLRLRLRRAGAGGVGKDGSVCPPGLAENQRPVDAGKEVDYLPLHPLRPRLSLGVEGEVSWGGGGRGELGGRGEVLIEGPGSKGAVASRRGNSKCAPVKVGGN